MSLEPGLSPLGSGIQLFLEDLDLLDIEVGSGVSFGLDVDGDEGLEGFATETNDDESSLDGDLLGRQRLAGKAITLPILLRPGPMAVDPGEAIEEALHRIATIINPRPDRLDGRFMLRFRRSGGVAKRLYVRAANGQALTVPGNEQRVKYDMPDILVRLESAEGVVWSDEYTDYTFTAGQTRTIVNAGTFTRLLPAYEVSAAGTVRLQHQDSGEDITYQSPGGPLTVSRNMAVRGTETDASIGSRVEGPSGQVLPSPPLLYPGDNPIKAFQACTLRVWSTYT